MNNIMTQKINNQIDLKNELFETIKISNDPDVIEKAVDNIEKIENNIKKLRQQRDDLKNK